MVATWSRSPAVSYHDAVSEDSQAQRIARIKRVELLDGAVAELVDHGWRGLQMQAVAKRVGVSRQTVYNAFSGRDGLARAVVEHLAESFLDGFDAAFAAAEAPAERCAAGVRYLLTRGGDDPSLRAMLGVGAEADVLGLLTSGSAPIVRRARECIPATALRYQPGLDSERLVQAAELLARLTLSQIVQPMAELDAAVHALTQMVIAYLAAADPSPTLLPSDAA